MLTLEKKTARIARAKHHAELDKLISGTYVSGSKGCSVGCDAIDILGAKKAAKASGLHAIVAGHDGTPEWLEHLRDAVFEGLPADKRSWWHVALAEALPVGVDFKPYYHKIQAAVLAFSLRQIEGNAEPYAVQCRAAIEVVQHLHLSAIEDAWDESAARSARSAAESAEWAAWSAARSAAWSARSAAWSARSAAESAEWAAARSAAESAAESAAWAAAWSAEWAAARSAAESAAWLEIAETIIAVFKDTPSAGVTAPENTTDKRGE